MRYVFRFLCVCALGVVPMVGCGENGGTMIVGTRFSVIDELVVTLNRVDGYGDQGGNEEYTFEVADLTVTHRWVGSNDPPDLLPPATRDAMDALVAVVQSTSYRFNENCEDLAIDGVPFSPRVTVRHGADELRLGVSDSECAGTDHSYHGPVMRCAAFEVVFGAVREIVPSVESETCAWYW